MLRAVCTQGTYNSTSRRAAMGVAAYLRLDLKNQKVFLVSSGSGSAASLRSAIGETVTLLHPPSTFSRCFNSDGERASAEWQYSRQRLLWPGALVVLPDLLLVQVDLVLRRLRHPAPPRVPCVVQTANTGHQSAGGNRSWCPELEVWTTHRPPGPPAC